MDAVVDKVTDVPVVAWPGWRGSQRDGRVAWLPDRLPARPRKIWEKPLTARALAGVAATEKIVVVADRELDDTVDAYFGLDAATGNEIWSVRNPAHGNLDYGNSPRATPLIHADRVYLFGAFGHLQCVSLADGEVHWSRNLRTEFKADDKRVWGACSSPIIVDGKLIVNPGAKEASIVALDPATGKTIWQCPGNPPSYSSFVAVHVAGSGLQIVGYDAVSLGGWDPKTGKRLWTLVPPKPRDFNVPTLVPLQGGIVATSENNGTRHYCFNSVGGLLSQPLAVNDDLAPDTHTPVLVGDRLFGVGRSLVCLDLKNGLKTCWEREEPAFGVYCTLVASANRVLCITQEGELILFDPKAERFAALSRVKLFDDEKGVYSHPALVGDRIYLRSSSAAVCISLRGQ